jgi:hypothetical protein
MLIIVSKNKKVYEKKVKSLIKSSESGSFRFDTQSWHAACIIKRRKAKTAKDIQIQVNELRGKKFIRR